jgi:hypothetical protein
MYKYVNDISELMHNIIKLHYLNCNIAVDATLGNGHDTDFLADYFSKVYSFDIQKTSVDNYGAKNRENVVVIHDSHVNLEAHIKEGIDVIVYNLGYLPGSSKEVTTKCDSTLTSIKIALKLLMPGGILLAVMYPGHTEGKKESESILEFAGELSKKEFGVMLHTFVNREKAPQLVIIEKVLNL